ncbi:MAG: DUF697 domain-containing protein [Abditibacteriales bacterium]|nr:DUF697 domain-containing protein [Abditibacteriales bacterium]MDW8367247.1 DUF697 domain-containing protein [Abditibacteriales bacterium]
MGYMKYLQQVLLKDYSRADEATRAKAAENLIDACSIACAALAVQPVPTLELAIMPIQAGMVLGIGHIYGHDISRERAMEIVTEIAGAVGISIVARQTLVTISKFLAPIVAGLISAPYVFGVTRGMGKAAIYYFQHTDLDMTQIKNIFNRAKQEAETHFDPRKVEEAAQEQQQELEQDAVTRMEQLRLLRDKGLISAEEYEAKRKEILAGL